MTKKLKKLPIGIQTFEEIISEAYTYVDKTQAVYDLVKGGKVYFLSRPRRFGKSLLVSTLEALFQNQRELFKGLWIDGSDYKWEKYPVIKISMPAVDSSMTLDDINQVLQRKLEEIAREYKLTLEPCRAALMLRELIISLERKYNTKVVVLIDEYDKPILDNISNSAKAEMIRDFLRTFYSELKENDAKLRFIFLTGVSRFSKVSIFSGLNNLKDISMDQRYASLCGYTQEELESNFKEYIDLYAEFNSGYSFKNQEELLATIKEWYNGYRFTESETKVYNPFSTLLLFDTKQFTDHWFATGTPSFLIGLIKKQKFNLRAMDEQLAADADLGNFDTKKIPLLATLFQTGYLTISSSRPIKNRAYPLDYPNKEVEHGFMNYLLSYSIDGDSSTGYTEKIRGFIEKGDLDSCLKVLKSFFAAIPYSIQEKKSSEIKQKENYYQSLMYAVFEVLGLRPQAEAQTNIGRSDMVVETAAAIYIWELKMDESPDAAIAQIHEKKYYEKYLHLGKAIKLIGVEFSSTERNITGFKVEEYK